MLTVVAEGTGWAVPAQIDDGAHARNELLATASHKLRTMYGITAATTGALASSNPTRAGSVATDERVIDRAAGAALAPCV